MRKPTPFARNDGDSVRRNAVRQYVSSLSQPLPRSRRSEPLSGPLGSTASSIRVFLDVVRPRITLLRLGHTHDFSQPTAVDGSFFNSIAHTAWALWSTEQPAVKLHLHFSVFEGAPR